MKYDLRRPCPKCPYRTDIPGYLHAERAREIAESLLGGSDFPCHQTTEYVESDEGDDMVRTPDSQMCAGALIMLENEGQPNQMMRIAERLGMYDPSKLDMDAPVAKRVVEFVAHHGGEPEDAHDTCSVVDAGCEWPAGHLVGGAVLPGETPPEALECCEDCGEPFCESCGEGGICNMCREDEHDE